MKKNEEGGVSSNGNVTLIWFFFLLVEFIPEFLCEGIKNLEIQFKGTAPVGQRGTEFCEKQNEGK
jgi:hypothetical protein